MAVGGQTESADVIGNFISPSERLLTGRTYHRKNNNLKDVKRTTICSSDSNHKLLRRNSEGEFSATLHEELRELFTDPGAPPLSSIIPSLPPVVMMCCPSQQDLTYGPDTILKVCVIPRAHMESRNLSTRYLRHKLREESKKVETREVQFLDKLESRNFQVVKERLLN